MGIINNRSCLLLSLLIFQTVSMYLSYEEMYTKMAPKEVKEYSGIEYYIIMHDINCKTVWGCRTLRSINDNYMIYRRMQII